MKRAFAIEEKHGGYIVHVNDNGYICAMCEYKNGDWKTCVFPTHEDAEQAKNDYNDVWK